MVLKNLKSVVTFEPFVLQTFTLHIWKWQRISQKTVETCLQCTTYSAGPDYKFQMVFFALLSPDLPIIAFMGPSLLWFSAISAVLAGVGPPKIVSNHNSRPNVFLSRFSDHDPGFCFHWQIIQPFGDQDYFTGKTHVSVKKAVP